MVRGKCVFLKVEDIIETVNEIKRFVKKDSRFGIKEIESRFTNPIPISDVTLKIVINREIVAELQLTVQTNAAAYNFAHKIYELQRTKVFSKLKITHNYFEESQQEFKEQASTALRLMGSKP
jgi:ubiquinone/menaquinone biosynthesis C-methylase UbiE